MGSKVRLDGQYFRGSVSWIRPLHESGAFGTGQCVMLLLMANLEFDGHGNATAWCPRSEMAETIGVSENAVREAMKGLKSSGAIKVRTPGHKGKATVYYVLPGHPWPTSPFEKDGSDRTTQRKGGSRKACRGVSKDLVGGSSETLPSLLTSEGVRDRANARLAPPRELDEF